MNMYHQSERRRQAILDYLNAIGREASVREIADGIEQAKHLASGTIMAMCTLGELARIGTGKATRYRAIATVTVSAVQMMSNVAKAQSLAQRSDAPEKKRHGVTVNNPSGHLPYPNQGGQGAVRQCVTIDCSGSY